jgi:hypothetical protein
MTQMISPHSAILKESTQLITILETHAAASPHLQQALTRHRTLHRDLVRHQHQSEHSLAAWRAALTQRWQSEVQGQRIFNQILQQLRSHYGTDAIQLQAIAPTSEVCTGTAEDLLNNMRRMYAALLLMQSSLPFGSDALQQLEHACNELDEALSATQRLETERRHHALERRMMQETCQRAIAETTHMLNDYLGIPVATNDMIPLRDFSTDKLELHYAE